jgi:hypothetical protein
MNSAAVRMLPGRLLVCCRQIVAFRSPVQIQDAPVLVLPQASAHLAKGAAAQFPLAAVVAARHLYVAGVDVPLAPRHIRECHVRAACHRTLRRETRCDYRYVCWLLHNPTRPADGSGFRRPGPRPASFGQVRTTARSSAPECRLMSGALLLLAYVSGVLADLSAHTHPTTLCSGCPQLGISMQTGNHEDGAPARPDAYCKTTIMHLNTSHEHQRGAGEPIVCVPAAHVSRPASARLSLSECLPLRVLRGWLQKLPLPSVANADATGIATGWWAFSLDCVHLYITIPEEPQAPNVYA